MSVVSKMSASLSSVLNGVIDRDWSIGDGHKDEVTLMLFDGSLFSWYTKQWNLIGLVPKHN